MPALRSLRSRRRVARRALARCAQTPADRAQTEALARRAAERLPALQREAESLAPQERTLLGRPAQARDRARRSRSSSSSRSSATPRTSRRSSTATTARTDGARRATRERQRPGRRGAAGRALQAGTRRLLAAAPRRQQPARLGRAYRTAAALGRIDRDRVEEHRADARGADDGARRRSQARARGAATRCERKAQRRAAPRSSAPSRRGRAWSRHRHAARPQRAADRRAAGRPAEAAGDAGAARRRAPGRGRDPAAAAVPGRAALAGRRGPVGPVRPAAAGAAGPPVRNGIEISLPEGQPVHAVHEGTVAFADPFTGYGNLVIVDHGDQTLLALRPSGRALPSKGRPRRRRARPSGWPGRNPSGNPALYFELRVDGKPVDPLQWLKR